MMIDFAILVNTSSEKQAIIKRCGDFLVVSLYNCNNECLHSYKGNDIDTEIKKLVNSGFMIIQSIIAMK